MLADQLRGTLGGTGYGESLRAAPKEFRSPKKAKGDRDDSGLDLPFFLFCCSNGCYLGGILMPPSTRMVSPFIYGLVMHSMTMNANSSPWPRRFGNSTLWPRWALN